MNISFFYSIFFANWQPAALTWKKNSALNKEYFSE